MLRKAHTATKTEHSVDAFSLEGQALLAMHSIAYPATDIRSEIQTATAGPQNPTSNFHQLAYSVFIIGTCLKRLNAPRVIHKGLK